MQDLTQKAVRGGAAKGIAQAFNFTLRLASLIILARILDPKDFGLVSMVTAVVGIFNVFRDFGLSAAVVQRKSITEQQSSTLFWINLLVGVILTLFTVALAPIAVRFYHEPRLLKLTMVLGTGFLFNAAGVQHAALLERRMRFVTLSVIDFVSLLTSTVIGIAMALYGCGYWALAVNTVIPPLLYTISTWVTTAWIPERPRRGIGLRSLLQFGSTVTLHGLVMYIASNMEKVLLGRFWGVQAVGIYGRASQLVNIPVDNLNSTVGGVAFAALSRVQDDPDRLRRFFLKTYSVVLCLTVPIAFACGAFASEIIEVFLGPKWRPAATIFSLLAPTTLAFAILNPIWWLTSALGLVSRGLRIALVLAPVMIGSYVLGLPYGPRGVAISYSSVLIISTLPLIAWAVHGTVISLGDIIAVLRRPLLAGAVAMGIAVTVRIVLLQNSASVVRLLVECLVLFGTYALTLIYALGQKTVLLDVFSTFRKSSGE